MTRSLSSALALTGLVLGLAVAQPALAADISGVWLTDTGDAHVRIAKCGANMCGTIVWLREPNDPATGRPRTDANNSDAARRGRPMMGIEVASGFHPTDSAATKFEGTFYNAKDGKTYRGSIVPAGADRLDVEGCLLVVCRSNPGRACTGLVGWATAPSPSPYATCAPNPRPAPHRIPRLSTPLRTPRLACGAQSLAAHSAVVHIRRITPSTCAGNRSVFHAGGLAGWGLEHVARRIAGGGIRLVRRDVGWRRRDGAAAHHPRRCRLGERRPSGRRRCRVTLARCRRGAERRGRHGAPTSRQLPHRACPASRRAPSRCCCPSTSTLSCAIAPNPGLPDLCVIRPREMGLLGMRPTVPTSDRLPFKSRRGWPA